MHSAIYQGTITEQHYSPIQHTSKRNTVMLYCDLEELPTLFQQSRFCSLEQFNLASFQRRNYLRPEMLTIPEAVNWHLKKSNLPMHCGPVRMLCNISILGICHNPISLYCCYSESNQLDYLLLDLNHPLWERDTFILDVREQTAPYTFNINRQFTDQNQLTDLDLVCQVQMPGDDLSITMHSYQNYERQNDVSLQLTHRQYSPELTDRLLLTSPLGPQRDLAYRMFDKIVFSAKRLSNNKPKVQSIS